MPTTEQPIFGYTVTSKGRLDLLNKMLNIYSAIQGEKFLRPKLISVLAFYVQFGYSVETKSLIMDSLGIKVENLNQINAELTKKGCLVRDSMNFKLKHLSSDMMELKNYFLKGDYSKILLVKFLDK